jgi:hypothetical protein
LDFIDDISRLSRVVFFESPAYWSVRDALNKSKEVRETGDLTGEPVLICWLFGNFLVILFLKPSLIAEHTSLLLLLN